MRIEVLLFFCIMCPLFLKAQAEKEKMNALLSNFQNCASCRFDIEVSRFDLKGNVLDTSSVSVFKEGEVFCQTGKGVIMIYLNNDLVMINTNNKMIQRQTIKPDKKKTTLSNIAVLAQMSDNWVIHSVGKDQFCLTCVINDSQYRAIKLYYDKSNVISLVIVEINAWNPNYGIWIPDGQISYRIQTKKGSKGNPVFQVSDYFKLSKGVLTPSARFSTFRIL